jgi:hypothetical protein
MLRIASEPDDGTKPRRRARRYRSTEPQEGSVSDQPRRKRQSTAEPTPMLTRLLSNELDRSDDFRLSYREPSYRRS